MSRLASASSLGADRGGRADMIFRFATGYRLLRLPTRPRTKPPLINHRRKGDEGQNLSSSFKPFVGLPAAPQGSVHLALNAEPSWQATPFPRSLLRIVCRMGRSK